MELAGDRGETALATKGYERGPRGALGRGERLARDGEPDG
jgi:hypothetical protein